MKDLQPYQKCVIEEHETLQGRIGRLQKFLETELFQSLELQERQLLVAQLHAMQSYKSVLELRIAKF